MRFNLITKKSLFFITLIILILVLWKTYWKLQIMYNSSILSMYTPDTFILPAHLSKKYEERVEKGRKAAKSKKVVFAALIRDVAERIPEIKKKVQRMGKLFKDYRILIVENDSTDNTRDLLVSWSKENPKVKILGCGYNVQKCSLPKMPKTDGHHVDRTRIEKMVKLRNIYLDEIKKSYRSDDGWDYSIFWDLDMISSVYLDGVCNSLGYLQDRKDVDVVCAYGIYRWGVLTLFYDTYALLYKNEKFHIDLKTVHDIRKGLFEIKLDRGEEPVEVDSCFSGFSIYRTSSLMPSNVRYDMSGDDNLECEHVRLHIKIKGVKVVNPSMIHMLLENS
jgi:hypothetical protein